MKSYKDLIAWQKSIELVQEIYKCTTDFHFTESFGITKQMRRASVSIPSNISEGHARNTTGEFKQFLGIAKGSLAELETLIIISDRLKYIEPKISENLHSRCQEISKLLHGLLKALSHRKKQ